MDIRQATKDDKKTIIQLWKYCFNNDSEAFINHYFDNVFSPKNTFVVTNNGKIGTSGQLNPYSFVFNENKVDTKYIIGLSSFPENRGDGSIRKFFNYIFKDFYDSGTPFTFLMAADYGLYRPYGFAHVMDKHLLTGKTKSLYQKTTKDFEMIPFSKNSSFEFIEEITNYYNSTVKTNYSDYVLRTTENFKNNLGELEADNGYAIILKKNDKVFGYLFYYFDKNKITIKEMLYDDDIVLKEILKFIYNHNTQFTDFEIRDDFPKSTSFFIPNPREINWEIMPFLMARVINLKNFISLSDLPQKINFDIRLKIIDKNIEGNNCICDIKSNEIHYKESNDDNKYDLSIDISLLPPLFFGYIKPKEAIMQTYLYDSKNKRLTEKFFNSFKEKNIFFNEYV